MREAQTDHMLDTCILQTCTEEISSFRNPVPSYEDAEEAINCGLDMRSGAEKRKPDMTPVEYDATIRLAITEAPSEKDRIKITKRFGETLTTPLIFDIVSPIQRGPSCIRLRLRKIDV